MNKIKKGDTVQVISGADKGRTGKVLKLIKSTEKQGCRILVEGINMIKKHVKPNPQLNIEGGIVSREASVHISNVALYDANKSQASRVGFRMLEDGTKVRYFKKTNEVVDTKA